MPLLFLPRDSTYGIKKRPVCRGPAAKKQRLEFTQLLTASPPAGPFACVASYGLPLTEPTPEIGSDQDGPVVGVDEI